MKQKIIKYGTFALAMAPALAMAEGEDLGISFTAAQGTVMAVGALAVTAALVPFGGKMAVAFGKGVFKLLFR